MKHNGVAVPACQSERNEAFTRAVRAGDAKTAAALAQVEPPEDATEAERERWRIRRSLYRRAGLLPARPSRSARTPARDEGGVSDGE